jgi:hypothetical protein
MRPDEIPAAHSMDTTWFAVDADGDGRTEDARWASVVRSVHMVGSSRRGP